MTGLHFGELLSQLACCDTAIDPETDPQKQQAEEPDQGRGEVLLCHWYVLLSLDWIAK
jgi:hypothetical protein